MSETALQLLNREIPETEGKTGQAMADAIGAAWENTDELTKHTLFTRMAMHLAVCSEEKTQ